MSIEGKEAAISDSSLNQGAVDLNARRRAALAEIDNAKFGWFHVKACAVAGVGFFTGASRRRRRRRRTTSWSRAGRVGAGGGTTTDTRNLSQMPTIFLR
jgi:hypothetical protein